MTVTRKEISDTFNKAKNQLLLHKGSADPFFGICIALDNCCVDKKLFDACLAIIDTRLGSTWLQQWLEQRGYDWRNNPEKLYQCRLDWLDSLIAEFAE